MNIFQKRDFTLYNIQEYTKLIRERLSDYRFHHSLCVAESAKALARRYGADEHKAEVAGILHGITKECSPEEQLEIIEKVSYDLTGNVIYPLCRVVNKEATDAQNAAADAFYQFLLSDEATAVFDKYLFDTNVEK